eukprot:222886_1
MDSCYKFIIPFTILISSILAACPCSDTSLCNNIQKYYPKELYGFAGGSNANISDPSNYNWTYLTSLVVLASATNNSAMDQFMCTAHKNGVRLIYWIPGKFPFTDDNNVTMTWIKNVFQTVTALHYDGVTFDYEGAMLWNQPQSAQYVNLINMTTQYFHTNLPGSTVSICVPFTAYLEWGRQYDYYNLAKASDYLYIMDYDVQTQIFDSQCIAKAVSPFETTQRGVGSYLNLGINASKLILGIPWYGRQWECIVDEMDGGPTSKYCPVVPTEQRGVNCTGVNHQNQEIPYAGTMNRVFTQKWNITAIRWDDIMKTHFVNIYGHNQNTSMMQIWYDDPESLSYKYQYAKSKNLRGVGPYQFGDLIFEHSSDEKERAMQMWAALDNFFV